MILLISPQGVYSTKRLIEETAALGISAKTASMRQMVQDVLPIDVADYEALYIRFPYPYLDEATALARQFVKAGKKVVDATMVDGDVDHDKFGPLVKALIAGLPVPQTFRLGQTSLKYPYVVKWDFGMKGRDVFLVKDDAGLQKAMHKHPTSELLVQQYVPVEFEYKVITVGYKSLPVVLRFAPHPKTGRPNFATAQTISSAELPELVQIAESAARATCRELAKVDILESGGKFYIVEINRWPGFQSFEQLTGYNVAKDFIQYIVSAKSAF